MEAQQTIAVSELRSNLSVIDAEARQLNDRLSKLNDERSHIVYVLEKYARERVAPSPAGSPQLRMPVTATDYIRGKKQEKIVEVLKEKQVPMKSEAIRGE